VELSWMRLGICGAIPFRFFVRADAEQRWKLPPSTVQSFAGAGLACGREEE